MIRTAKVVLGSGFGDEGKGKLVAFYASPQTTVIRSNGGSQAGHTVCFDDKRHVFHHFGSGSFHGARTFLSRFFISNPIHYFQELATLKDLGIQPIVSADPAGLVTTPFDMMLNQMVEQSRGLHRHGSCGIGINESMKRSEAGYPIIVADLSRSALRDLLRLIRADWLPIRLAQLAVKPSDEWQARLDSDAILDTFIDQCVAYRRTITEFDWTGDVVFEGAQGLLLDEDHRFFPYVTHSHTGLQNVTTLASEAGIDALDVTYVTRAYATRHGAGPFPHEVLGLKFADQTNVPNDWQGVLRFGHLDLDLLVESINADLQKATLPVRHGVAITCLDQLTDVTYWHHGQRYVVENNEFVRQVSNAVTAAFCLTSRGAEADIISESSD